MWPLSRETLRVMARRPALWLAGFALILFIRFPAKYLRDAPYVMDFHVYRAVGERVLAQGGVGLYEPYRGLDTVFKYAPGWAPLFVPLAWVSPYLGTALWAILTLGCLVLTGVLCLSLCRRMGLDPPGVFIGAAALLLVRPITSEFLLGQADTLWAVLTTGFLAAEMTRRPWTAAILLALAVSLKLPALLFVAYLALRGRWASLGRVLLCLLVVNLAAAWWLLPERPLSLFAAWRQALASNASTFAFEIGNQSLWTLAGRLLREDGYGLNLLVLNDGAVVGLAALLQTALFLVLFARRHSSPPQTHAMILDGALLTVLMVLCSPSAWVATYSALFFPTGIASAVWFTQWRTTVHRPALLFGALAALLLSLLTHAKVWRALGITYFRGESYVYLVLMILPLFGLALIWTLWGHYRELAAAARRTSCS